jgi:hypothetical protein
MVRSRTREKWSIWYDVQTMTMQTPAHLVTGPDRLSMKNGTLLFCMAKTSAPSRFFMDSRKKPVFASHFKSTGRTRDHVSEFCSIFSRQSTFEKELLKKLQGFRTGSRWTCKSICPPGRAVDSRRSFREELRITSHSSVRVFVPVRVHSRWTCKSICPPGRRGRFEMDLLKNRE